MNEKYNDPVGEERTDILTAEDDMPFHPADLKTLFLGGKFIVRNAVRDEDYEIGKALLKMGMERGNTDSARELLQAYERDSYSEEDLIAERLQCVRLILEKTEDHEEIYRLIRQYYPYLPSAEVLYRLDGIANGFGIHDSLKTLAMVLSTKIDHAHYSKRLLIQKAYENRFMHECLAYLQENLRISQLDNLNEETALYYYEKMEKEGRGKEFVEALEKTDTCYKDAVLKEIDQRKRMQTEKKKSMKKRYAEDLHHLHDLLDKKV